MEMQQLLHATAFGGAGSFVPGREKGSWNYSYQGRKSGTQGHWGDGGYPSLESPAGLSPWLVLGPWDSRLKAASEAKREKQQGWKGCRDGQLELMQWGNGNIGCKPARISWFSFPRSWGSWFAWRQTPNKITSGREPFVHCHFLDNYGRWGQFFPA